MLNPGPDRRSVPEQEEENERRHSEKKTVDESRMYLLAHRAVPALALPLHAPRMRQ